MIFDDSSLTDTIRVMPREQFLLPSMLPYDYTHRVSFRHTDGSMTWRWFTSEVAARAWVAELEREPTNEEWEALQAMDECRKGPRY